MFFFGVNPGRKLANETADLLGIQRNLFDTALLEHKVTWGSFKPLANSGFTADDLASDILFQLETGLDRLTMKFGSQPEISAAHVQLRLYSVSQKRLKDTAKHSLLDILEIGYKPEKTLLEDVRCAAFSSMANKFIELESLDALIVSYVWTLYDDVFNTQRLAIELSTNEAHIRSSCNTLISKSLLVDNGIRDGSMVIGRTKIGNLIGRRIALAWLSVVENAERSV